MKFVPFPDIHTQRKQNRSVSSNYDQLLNGFDHVLYSAFLLKQSFLFDQVLWEHTESSRVESMNSILKANAFSGITNMQTEIC